MASDGERVFVLGGVLPPGAQVDEAKLIHVLDTSMFLFVILFGQHSSLKQSSSITQSPTSTLSRIVRKLPNFLRYYPQVTRPRVNHNTRHYFRRILMAKVQRSLMKS